MARKRDGFIRECHGDLHLGNMVLLDDAVVIFDCIEFNDTLRWIDVASADLAVLQRQRTTLEPLTAAEQACALTIDTDAPQALQGLLETIRTMGDGP